MRTTLTRRGLLAAALALAPGVALAAADDCGCAGPKSNPKNRAEQFYQMALAAEDPARRRQLAELALKIWPEHEGAQAILAELSQ